MWSELLSRDPQPLVIYEGTVPHWRSHKDRLLETPLFARRLQVATLYLRIGLQREWEDDLEREVTHMLDLFQYGSPREVLFDRDWHANWRELLRDYESVPWTPDL